MKGNLGCLNREGEGQFLKLGGRHFMGFSNHLVVFLLLWGSPTLTTMGGWLSTGAGDRALAVVRLFSVVFHRFLDRLARRHSKDGITRKILSHCHVQCNAGNITFSPTPPTTHEQFS